MSKSKDGGTAFPVPNLHDHEEFNGMSLRDYIAIKAMQGELASQKDESDSYISKTDLRGLASWSYAAADAMLEARDQA